LPMTKAVPIGATRGEPAAPRDISNMGTIPESSPRVQDRTSESRAPRRSLVLASSSDRARAYPGTCGFAIARLLHAGPAVAILQRVHQIRKWFWPVVSEGVCLGGGN
jgi:hypothetical protein